MDKLIIAYLAIGAASAWQGSPICESELTAVEDTLQHAELLEAVANKHHDTDTMSGNFYYDIVQEFGAQYVNYLNVGRVEPALKVLKEVYEGSDWDDSVLIGFFW